MWLLKHKLNGKDYHRRANTFCFQNLPISRNCKSQHCLLIISKIISAVSILTQGQIQRNVFGGAK